MSDELRREKPEDTANDLRLEIADLRERVLRLEALTGSNYAAGRIAADHSAPDVQARRQTVDDTAPSISAESRPVESGQSMEAVIGSQWLSKVGVLAVLVAVALFLKLAIDNHWIGAAARIVLGLAAGVAVFAGAEPFRRRGYPGFSATLSGIGTGILYLSLWASFSLYHLLPVVAVAIGMIVVTLVNGLLAWRQNSPALAAYAIVGGMLTPFLLSNAQHHEAALFAYLLLLSVGACVLALARGWNGLMLAAFAGSAIYAIAWAFFWYRADAFDVTVIFAAAGFLLFALIPFAPGNLPSHHESRTALAITNAIGGVVLGIALFTGLAQVLVILGLAAFYYILMWLHRNSTELPLARWTIEFNGNMAVLVGVTLLIGWLWQGSAQMSSVHTGEQLSYSFWFIGFGGLLVILGLWRRRVALRWQGLALLLASIVKVFVVDMEFLSAGLRVFSFLVLGLLLLVVSFVYQRDWLKLRRS